MIIKRSGKMSMKVVILCGGFGTRLREQTELKPNPIPENVNKDIWRICYIPEELSDAINHFLNISDEERDVLKKSGEEIRALYFEPVTRESVRKFLRLQ
jgi:choline kinase